MKLLTGDKLAIKYLATIRMTVVGVSCLEEVYSSLVDLKAKYRSTKGGGEDECSGRVSRLCSTSHAHC
jgi:hypothetical protein